MDHIEQMRETSIDIKTKTYAYKVELILERKEYYPEELEAAFSEERKEAIFHTIVGVEDRDAMWPLFGGTIRIGGDTYQAFAQGPSRKQSRK